MRLGECFTVPGRMADWIEAIETIGDAGYTVSIGVARTGLHVVTAIDERTDETFIVRGADLYAAACEVAGQVGLRLDAPGPSDPSLAAEQQGG